MEFEEGSLKSCFGNHKLYARYYKPASTAKAVVFVAHGLSEHCGRYHDIALRLQKENCFVFLHDHVGHGKSEGNRILIDGFESYAKDVFSHFDLISNRVPQNLPKFIVGHSMGGTISIKCGLMKPDFFKGIVLVSPGIAANPNDASFIKVQLGRWVNVVAPNFPVHLIEPNKITSDPERVKAFVDDELCYHGWVKVGWAIAMLNMTKEIESSLTDIKWPFYLLQGSEDRITMARFAQEFYEKAGSQDKKYKVYDNVLHNLLHEVDDVKVSTENEVVNWINERITQN